jgi:hypothetical protein
MSQLYYRRYFPRLLYSFYRAPVKAERVFGLPLAWGGGRLPGASRGYQDRNSGKGE